MFVPRNELWNGWIPSYAPILKRVERARDDGNETKGRMRRRASQSSRAVDRRRLRCFRSCMR